MFFLVMYRVCFKQIKLMKLYDNIHEPHYELFFFHSILLSGLSRFISALSATLFNIIFVLLFFLVPDTVP